MATNDGENVMGSLNASLAAKIKSKHDPVLEKNLRHWMAQLLDNLELLDDSVSLQAQLKNGVILCQFMNKLIPGAIKRINTSALPFKEMENISNYVNVCERIGLTESERFQTVDLYDGKDMICVMNHLRVLKLLSEKHNGKLSELLENSAPTTVSGGVSPLNPTNAEKRKSRPLMVSSLRSSQSVGGDSPARKTWNIGVINTSYSSSSNLAGSISSSESNEPAGQPSVSSLVDDISTKEEFKYSPELEQGAKNWIRALLNNESLFTEQSLAEQLKSGEILCQMMNVIQPGMISKINTSKFNYSQMENIGNYLKACIELGLPKTDLFDTPDLWDKKNMNLVINNIHLLAHFVQKQAQFSHVPKIADSSNVRTLYSSALSEKKLSSVLEEDQERELVGMERELTQWMNTQLQKCIPPASVPHLSARGIRTGVMLLKLLEVLTKTSVGFYEENPTILWHCMQNASLVLRVIYQQTFVELGLKAPMIVLGKVESIIELLRFLRDKFDMEYFFLSVLNEGAEKPLSLEDMETAERAKESLTEGDTNMSSEDARRQQELQDAQEELIQLQREIERAQYEKTHHQKKSVSSKTIKRTTKRERPTLASLTPRGTISGASASSLTTPRGFESSPRRSTPRGDSTRTSHTPKPLTPRDDSSTTPLSSTTSTTSSTATATTVAVSPREQEAIQTTTQVQVKVTQVQERVPLSLSPRQSIVVPTEPSPRKLSGFDKLLARITPEGLSTESSTSPRSVSPTPIVSSTTTPTENTITITSSEESNTKTPTTTTTTKEEEQPLSLPKKLPEVIIPDATLVNVDLSEPAPPPPQPLATTTSPEHSTVPEEQHHHHEESEPTVVPKEPVVVVDNSTSNDTPPSPTCDNNIASVATEPESNAQISSTATTAAEPSAPTNVASTNTSHEPQKVENVKLEQKTKNKEDKETLTDTLEAVPLPSLIGTEPEQKVVAIPGATPFTDEAFTIVAATESSTEHHHHHHHHHHNQHNVESEGESDASGSDSRSESDTESSNSDSDTEDDEYDEEDTDSESSSDGDFESDSDGEDTTSKSSHPSSSTNTHAPPPSITIEVEEEIRKREEADLQRLEQIKEAEKRAMERIAQLQRERMEAEQRAKEIKQKRSLESQKRKSQISSSTQQIMQADETQERVLKAQISVRKRVVNELLQTEKNYVKSLESVEQGVLQPLKYCEKKPSAILKRNEFTACFANLSQLLTEHKALLQLFIDRIEDNWTDDSTIGDIFLRKMDIFKKYKNYLVNYNLSIVALQSLKQSKPRFKALVDKFQRLEMKSSRLSLESFLIMPIQRIPRYLMLLADINKFTNKTHLDHEYLPRAIEELNRTLQSHNQCIDPKSAEHAQKMLAVASSIANTEDLPAEITGGSLVEAGRKLLKEGHLVVSHEKGLTSCIKSTKVKQLKKSATYCFLFSDVMLFCNELAGKSSESDEAFEVIDAFAAKQVTQVVAKGSHAILVSIGSRGAWKLKIPNSTLCKEWLTELQTLTTSK